MTSAVYRTDKRCWRCSRLLFRLAPPIDGWEHYCRKCESLTLTAEQAAHGQQTVPKGSVGFVAAVRRPLQISYDDPANVPPWE